MFYSSQREISRGLQNKYQKSQHGVNSFNQKAKQEVIFSNTQEIKSDSYLKKKKNIFVILFVSFLKRITQTSSKFIENCDVKTKELCFLLFVHKINNNDLDEINKTNVAYPVSNFEPWAILSRIKMYSLSSGT